MLRRLWLWLWPPEEDLYRHRWTLWQIVQEPQLFITGYQARRCLDCGLRQYEQLSSATRRCANVKERMTHGQSETTDANEGGIKKESATGFVDNCVVGTDVAD